MSTLLTSSFLTTCACNELLGSSGVLISASSAASACIGAAGAGTTAAVVASSVLTGLAGSAATDGLAGSTCSTSFVPDFASEIFVSSFVSGAAAASVAVVDAGWSLLTLSLEVLLLPDAADLAALSACNRSKTICRILAPASTDGAAVVGLVATFLLSVVVAGGVTTAGVVVGDFFLEAA